MAGDATHIKSRKCGQYEEGTPMPISRLGVIPPGKRDDAMHVAVCTVLEFDVLLSWNFQHLANIKKQIRINTANQNEGYLKPLLLLTPLELMGDETDNE